MSFEETQSILEAIIQKPQINTQLLARPPFKFILDIVSNVVKATGYLKSDFPEEELHKAGDDKNSKTAFLEKLIKLLDDDGSLKNVKAAKIISGKDAEETNKMLQKLGKNAAASSNSNSTKPEKKKKSSKDGSSKERKSKKDSEKKEKEKEKKEKEPEEKEKKKKKSSSSKERERGEKKKEKEKEKEKKKTEPKERVLKRADSMIAINGDAPDTPNNDEGYEEETQDSLILLDAQTPSLQTPLSSNRIENGGIETRESPRMIKPEDRALMTRPNTGAGGRPMTSMGRPGTASSRPAPPKIKKKQIATIDSAPQAVIELKSEIINDSQKLTEDADAEDNFIMENEEEETRPISAAEVVDEEDRGALVQKIMDKKAEIEDGIVGDNVESENDRMISVEREKVRALQEKLQDLTRSAYPLARLFDFANDDIESMIKELERWRSEQRKQEQEDQNKKAAGFGDSSRLYNIIANLQKEITDMKEELSKARGRVLNNDKRIQLFISNV